MSKLIRWDTPFADSFFPSVTAGFTTADLHQETILRIVVSDGAVFPKYSVEFRKVLVFSCVDEGCAPERKWPDTEQYDSNPCAWIWTDSPSIKSYQNCNFDSDGLPEKMDHYLIFGGDNNVEVIAKDQPTINTLNESGKLDFVFHY